MMQPRQTFEDFAKVMNEESLSSCFLLVQDSATSATYKMPAEALMKQLLSEYVDQTGFKSMAYADKEDYAVISHDHDIYTSAYAIPNTFGEKKTFKILSINDKTHNKTYDLSAPMVASSSSSDIDDMISAIQPKLGTIEFRPQVETIDIKLTSFNGWVPADGRSYALTDFVASEDLPNVFNVSNGRFTVPTISNFLKINVSLDSSCTYHGQHYAIAPHTHTASPSETAINATILSNDLGMIGTGEKHLLLKTKKTGVSNGQYVHNGKGAGNWVSTSCKTDINPDTFSDAHLKTLKNGSNNVSFNPSYNLVNAYVYVGRSKYSSPFTASASS